jgi:hypothetical protein
LLSTSSSISAVVALDEGSPCANRESLQTSQTATPRADVDCMEDASASVLRRVWAITMCNGGCCNIELATGALEPFLPTGEARLELLHGSRF